MNSSLAKILLVEDDRPLAGRLVEALRLMGYDPMDPKSSGAEALDAVACHAPDLILMDIMLEGAMDGVETAGRINRKWDIPVLFLTGSPSEENIFRARETQAQGYLIKPFSNRQLKAAIEMALASFRRQRSYMEERAKLETLSKYALDCEMLIDEKGSFRYVGPACLEITGRPPELFLAEPDAYLQMIHPEDRPHVERFWREELKDRPDWRDEFRIYTPWGETKWLSHYCRAVYDSEGRFLGRRISARDISDQKAAAAKSEMARKVECLSVVAGGVAHYFNNLLQGVLGNAEIGLEDLDDMEQVRKRLLSIREIAQKGAEITHRMLTSTGGRPPVKRKFRLDQLLFRIEHSLAEMMGDEARLVLKPGLSTPLVEGDETQIEKLIFYLAQNAVEATRNKGGRVTIHTGGMECTTRMLAETHVDDQLPPGLYAYLAVIDEGVGMSPEVSSRIFDPFFTTKFIGRGMSLAEVLGVVRSHKGAVAVNSSPGKGSSFRIYLPSITLVSAE